MKRPLAKRCVAAMEWALDATGAAFGEDAVEFVSHSFSGNFTHAVGVFANRLRCRWFDREVQASGKANGSK